VGSLCRGRSSASGGIGGWTPAAGQWGLLDSNSKQGKRPSAHSGRSGGVYGCEPAQQHVQLSAPWVYLSCMWDRLGPACHAICLTQSLTPAAVVLEVFLVLVPPSLAAGGHGCRHCLACLATREGTCAQPPQGLRASFSTGRRCCRRRVREHGLPATGADPAWVTGSTRESRGVGGRGAAGAWACNLVRCIGHAHMTVYLPAAVHVAAAACAAPCWYKATHWCSGGAMQPCVHRWCCRAPRDHIISYFTVVSCGPS
jgi:hypothetical protein